MKPYGHIWAIDPGTTKSALVRLDGATPWRSEIADNERIVDLLLARIRGVPGDTLLAIEMIASYGMAVGKTTFETCVWIGRFVQAWQPGDVRFVYRREVKSLLCGSMRAKDANIRQALIDRYPASGGGKTPQVGTKAQPGPLYGFNSHLWSALGVGIVALETD